MGDQSLCYAGPGSALLPVLEEATSEDSTRVLVFILTVNNDWSQVLLEIDQPSFQVITSSDQLEAWAKLIRPGISTGPMAIFQDR